MQFKSGQVLSNYRGCLYQLRMRVERTDKGDNIRDQSVIKMNRGY